MFNFNAWSHALGEILSLIVRETAVFLPSLFGAFLVFLSGLILGSWAKKTLLGALRLIRFEALIKDSNVKKFLIKAEINQKLEDLMGTALKWLIVLVFFIASVNILGLTAVSALLGAILSYLPRVLSAVIVLAIGVLLAGLVERLVKGGLATLDLHSARLMGKIASYTVVTIATLAALSELKIAEGFINTLFIGFVAMLSLGFGLAIGLGAKDLVSRLLLNWYQNFAKDLKKQK